MPKNETRLITRTEDEDRRIREAVAKRTADRALKEIRQQMQALDAQLQLLKGIVSREDLARIYEKDVQTI